MSGDGRLYAKFTLDFADSPKIAPLSDRAFRELVESVLWSRRIMTDGLIPQRMVRRLFTDEALAELTSNGSPASLLQHDDGSVEIHDFAEHQATRAQIEKWSAAGKTAAAARYGTKSSRATKGGGSGKGGAPSRSEKVVEQNADLPASSTIRSAIAEKSHNQTETETETLTAAPRTRGSRISENFVVDDALRAYAAERAPAVTNVDRERDQFVNHWLSASGKSAVKIDWRRAFMTWLGNAQRFAEERGWQPNSKSAQSATLQSESRSAMIEWLDGVGVTIDEWNERKSDPQWVEALKAASRG